MHFVIEIDSRDALIEFSHRLGRALKESQRLKPWVISMGADENSGKSLIALAVDQVFNPDMYPEGLHQNLSADLILEANEYAKPVVFRNFGRIVYSMSYFFDEALERYEDEAPEARVLFAANIKRTLTGNFNYEAKGLDSDRLDINMHVHVLPENFRRLIAITVEDESMISALQEIISSQAPVPRQDWAIQP